MRGYAGHGQAGVAVHQFAFQRAVLIIHVKRVRRGLAPVARQHGHCLIRHDVHARAGSDFDQPRVVERRVQRQLEAALFGVDKREIRVRREAPIRQADFLLIIFEILHAALLVAAQNQAAAAAERNARIQNGLHREHGGHTRPLIVAGAAADHATVDDFRAVGIVIPAIAFRHDVQMAQHGDHLVALADFRVAAIAVHVARLHAQALQIRHRGIQRAADIRAKGRVLGAALRANARHANPALKRFDHIALKGFQFGIQFLVVLHLETPFFFGVLGRCPKPRQGTHFPAPSGY